MQLPPEHADLLTALRREATALRGLLARSSDTAGYEDPVYRFYHHSFKVFGLQSLTEQIVAALKGLVPSRVPAASVMRSRAILCGIWNGA